MARNPIVFNNGTLVSNAKVEIGGTIYDVEPAQYEGTTPLSANNLNQLQTNLYDYADEKSEENKDYIDNLVISKTQYNITPDSGRNYSTWGNSFYYKVGNRVHVHLGLEELTANTIQSITTLPVGYRPSTVIASVGIGNNIEQICKVMIYTGGTLRVYSEGTHALVDIEFYV